MMAEADDVRRCLETKGTVGGEEIRGLMQMSVHVQASGHREWAQRGRNHR